MTYLEKQLQVIQTSVTSLKFISILNSEPLHFKASGVEGT